MISGMRRRKKEDNGRMRKSTYIPSGMIKAAWYGRKTSRAPRLTGLRGILGRARNG
jgi:hypothetical protein